MDRRGQEGVSLTLGTALPPQEGADLARWPCRFVRVRPDAPPEVVTGHVVGEEPLEIVLNGRTVAVLMRTPGHEKELAAGFCLGEGLIEDFRDVVLIQHCGQSTLSPDASDDPLDASRNQVRITLRAGAPVRQSRNEVARLIRSGCGRADVSEVLWDLPPLPRGEMRVPARVLGGLSGQMAAQQEVYRESGGIHAAAVFTAEGLLVTLQEDVGRHNAVDKATGYCLLRGIPLTDKVLVSTGRASYDMVVKAVRLGVPIVASRSSPTSLALQLAQHLNCTLIGYLRRERFQVYTHSWRIPGGGDESTGDE